MDFTAIDFETANPSRSSACSLGIAVVRNNAIVDKMHYLIKPTPLKFDPFNVAIHGITEDDVRDAPTFDELWKEISPLFDRQLIVAHNTSFDISVLRRTLEFYNIEVPCIDFLCTYRLSTAAFPDSGSHRLNVISKILNIELDHHDAKSDAAACAEILCKLANSNNLNTLDDVSKFYDISAGHMYHYYGFRYESCHFNHRCHVTSHKKNLRASEYEDIESDYIDNDFYQKNFVFTGTLLSMPRSKAYEIVATGGGRPQDHITKETNYLVVGLQDYKKLNGGMSTKMKKAYEYKERGQDIKIIIEDEFLSLIDDELYAKCGMISH